MTLIGIAGAKRAGKSTLAQGLALVTGLPEESFAAPLREFVARITGMTARELDARKEEPLDWLDGVTPRQMMQTVGTEWGRQMIHPEIWLRSLFARIPPQGAIISDVRFPNEAQAILDRGGIVFRVNRPGLPQGDGHLSEVPLPPELVTVDLWNTKAPRDLIEAAMNCLGLSLSQPAAACNHEREVWLDGRGFVCAACSRPMLRRPNPPATNTGD